ncbi:GGDEF domain-containing protein [Desulfocicer niacini]
MPFPKHRINRRVIRDLKKRSSLGIFFYFLIPYLLLFSDDYFYRHPQFSFFFLTVQTLICGFRFSHLLISDKSPDKFERINNTIFLTSVVLTALAWGTGQAYFLFQEGEQKVQLLMTICTVGFCAGGVVSFLPERRLSIAYNMLMFLPGSLAVFIRGNNVTLGAFILCYSLYLVLITLRGSDEYWRALENEFLLEKKSRELKQASRIDVLTGLYNRRHFDELFHLAWGLCARRQNPICLVMCDIDLFKRINDTFGHMAGDEYLQLLSRCLLEIFKRETDVVARYGGEEFVVLLPDKGIDAAMALAETFRGKVADSVLDYNGEKIKTTISMGIACCIPETDQRPELLVFKADTALYKAKNGGRNRVMVHDGENLSFLPNWPTA